MALGRIVDAVDDWLLDHVHRSFSPAGPAWGPGPGALGPEPDVGPSGGDALAEHRRAREALRRATAGVLFLRNKLEAEQTERRVRMARACHAILRAAREDDDETALPLLAYRDVLRERLRAAEEELAGLRTQAADAKDGLARLSRSIERLEIAHRRRRAPRRTHRDGPR